MSTSADVSWTYDPDDLQTDSDEGRLARTRLHLGDTFEERPLMGDAEIEYFLSESGNNEKLAAAQAAETLANRYAGMPTRTIGDLRIDYQSLVVSLRSTASALRAEDARSGITPWIGSHKKLTKESNEQDDSLVQPFAKVGKHDSRLGSDDYNELRADI